MAWWAALKARKASPEATPSSPSKENTRVAPVSVRWICGARDSATFRHSSLASHLAPIPGELTAEAAFHAVPRSGSLDVPWDRGHPSGKK